MTTIARILLLALLLAASPVYGDVPENLYSATVPVADYSESERSRAIRSGLEQVLVRLTGRSDIAGEPRVARLLANSAAYAYEFGYVELQPRELGQGLRVAYTRGEIDSYLRQHQLPVWPQQRPPLLVWVLRESAGQSPAFVQPEEDQALYDTLGSLFDGRGMPVRYPLHDLEDQLALPAEEAWGLDPQRIGAASDRYGTQYWLVVRCYETSAQTWRLAWMLGGGDGAADLHSLDGENLDDALAQVVDRAVNQVAAGQAYIPSLSGQGLVVDIDGIGDYASYTELMSVLSEMSLVKSLAVQRVSGERLTLDVEIEGDRQVFVSALSVFRQIAVAEQQPVDRLALSWRSLPGRR